MARSQNKDREVSRQYDNATIDELYKAYGRCSHAKQQAWENCKRICGEYNGDGLRILGHNGYQFSAGFLFTDPEIGNIKIAKITKSGVTVYDYL